jgi:hypothetical protein
MKCQVHAVLLTILGWTAALGCPQIAQGADPSDAKPAPAAAIVDAKTLREQTIYIPYDKLRSVFEQHGRGVFLPYEKFQELWQAARAQTAPAAAVKPPVGALITEIENEAVAGKDVVRVKAQLKIEVLAEGWSEIPLRLADSAITSATLGDQPARILGGPDQGYRLLVFKKDKTPERIELRLEYAKAITKVPGQNSVSFEAPSVPVSRWKVRIPEAGVKVNIQPMIAATEAPAGKSETPPGKPAAAAKREEETVVLAFVGAAPTVRIGWTPKAEGAAGMEALASVQAEQQVWITEGAARTKVKLSYSISRAELGQLALEVPADQKVTNVFDANVRQWTVQPSDKGQKITLQLFEPAKATQDVVVELEKFSGDQAALNFSVPVVKALGVGRQQGVIVVDVAAGLRAEAGRTSGLLQLDRNDLPAGLAGANWAFAFRYATVPFELLLNVEKVQPRVTADALVEAYLEPERLSVDMTAVYTIERAGVFRLELDVPAGYEVIRVAGADVAGAAAVQVDGHHLEGAKKERLVVDLARKALGRVALVIQLQKDLHEPALTAPSEKSADIPLAIPRVAAGTVETSSGRLVVYAPESLRVNPGKLDGLRNISFKEAGENIASYRSSKPGDARPVLAFAYTQDAVQITLDAQRRKPQVTIDQLLQVRVEDGVVKYQATLFYHVRYSGVKALRIDVPKSVATRLRNNTRTVREKEIQPPPKDTEANCVAWSLTGESELMGDGHIDLVWEDEQSVGKLEIGKSVTFAVPRLVPKDVDRAWGQIVLTKTETIDIQEDENSKGLRPIDPQHDLMPGAAVPGAARAFEFHDEWSLSVTAARYRLEEVKRTSIERAVVQMVLTSANQVSVRARYRMRSARQRLEVQLPDQVQFDTQPVRIDTRPIILERGQQGRFFIPLVDRSPDQSFLLELRYTLPEHSGKQLDLPYFPQESAVQKVYLCVYLPEQRVLMAKQGPWTEEFTWELGSDLHWSARGTINENQLNDWVDSTAGKASLGDTFQTDRQLYIFSTLQPPAPPDGSLRLCILGDERLTLTLLAVLVVLGLLLIRTSVGTKVLCVGLLVIAMVLLGLFWPIAAHQLLNGRFFAAMFIVLILWCVGGFYRCRHTIGCCGKREPPATAQQPPVPPPLEPTAPVTAETVPSPAEAVTPPTPPTPPVEQQGGESHE